jgi:uroporphyrinogen-III synthase
VAQTPTTEGVIASLRVQDLVGKTVGVQMYSDSNPPLLHFLQEIGAKADTVLPYVYAPASDGERVAELVQQLAASEVDAIVFTSSPQADRLFEVARERNIEPLLRDGFTRTQVASVGPVLSEHLHALGVPVHICPEQGFVMKNLVLQIKRALGS